MSPLEVFKSQKTPCESCTMQDFGSLALHTIATLLYLLDAGARLEAIM